MFIVYLASGIFAGLCAAIFALVSGSGFLMALGAYVVGGVIGTVAATVLVPVPQRTVRSKQALTQYN